MGTVRMRILVLLGIILMIVGAIMVARDLGMW